MTMRDYLIDLYRHQEWADAELWRACESHAGALTDRALWHRLHHIHIVQRFFLAVARGENVHAMKITKPEDYVTPDALKSEAKHSHRDAASFLDSSEPDALKRAVNIPWFKEPPLDLPLEQALLQAALHSHYHRGQNATRLRELGGVPPLTDYIVWLWKGRAAAEWT
jgi:uncharacterized damage-inducible protein DinB